MYILNDMFYIHFSVFNGLSCKLLFIFEQCFSLSVKLDIQAFCDILK